LRRLLYLTLVAPIAFLILQQPPISLYAVVSGSMEPDIPRGSLVVVEAVPPMLGEAAAYRIEVDGRSYVLIHRVVGMGDGQYTFKGDAVEGPETVPASNVIGRVALAIPHLGYLYMAGLANPLLVALLIVIALMPSGGSSNLLPISLATGVLAFAFPGRGLTALIGAAPYLAYSTATASALYLLERRLGPHPLISLSHALLIAANSMSTDLGGVLRWLGA
jgi:signal peptidase